MTASTIVRLELNDQVYASIRQRLLTRELGPGARLSLQALADELGVSRSPVHHALTRLVTEGLVSTTRRGYAVRPITSGLMDEAHDVRLALELWAAEKAVGALPADRLATFRQLMQRTIDVVEGDRLVDARAYMLANKEFHEYQVDLAGNELMSDVYRRLALHQLMERALLSRDWTAAGDSTSEHRRIVEAYERGDLEDARAALRANVETGKRLARAAIDEAGGKL